MFYCNSNLLMSEMKFQGEVFYYSLTCDVVWTPCLAKQVKAMECIHSTVTFTVQHLRDKLSSCFYYSLVEHHTFHALVQIFRLLAK